MAEQQEMNVSKKYNDGLKNIAEFWQKNGLCPPFSLNEVIHSVTKNACSGLEIYKEWISVLSQVSDDSMVMWQKAMKGEKTDTETFLQSSAQKCEDLTDQMMQRIKDTPFENMEPVLKSVKDAMNFKKNGHLLKSLIQPGLEMSLIMLGMLRSSCSSALNVTSSAMKRSLETSTPASV